MRLPDKLGDNLGNAVALSCVIASIDIVGYGDDDKWAYERVSTHRRLPSLPEDPSGADAGCALSSLHHY